MQKVVRDEGKIERGWKVMNTERKGNKESVKKHENLERKETREREGDRERDISCLTRSGEKVLMADWIQIRRETLSFGIVLRQCSFC